MLGERDLRKAIEVFSVVPNDGNFCNVIESDGGIAALSGGSGGGILAEIIVTGRLYNQCNRNTVVTTSV